MFMFLCLQYYILIGCTAFCALHVAFLINIIIAVTDCLNLVKEVEAKVTIRKITEFRGFV